METKIRKGRWVMERQQQDVRKVELQGVSAGVPHILGTDINSEFGR